MLHRIYSDLPTFKEVKFHAGLNIILTTKEKVSSDGRTRNGSGKSSLIELINTLLGSEIRSENSLKSKELVNYRFGLEVEIGGRGLIVEREGASPSRIYVKKLPGNFIPLSEDGRGYFIPNDEWLSFLGKYTFGLGEDSRSKNEPSFRSLFSYFARSTKGFDSPEKYFPQQPLGSIQVALTYLLHLDWRLARDFDGIRQKDKLIKALKTAANEGTLGEIIGSASDLRTEILLKSAQLEKLKRALSEFRVLPEYEAMEARASEIGKQLSLLSADDVADKEWLAQIERVLESELSADTTKVDRLFLEASLELPDFVKKRFDDVAAFHASIIKNRKEHLRQEVADISRRIEKRLEEKKKLDDERSGILLLLQSHGALNQYMEIQRSASRLDAEIEQLGKKLSATENLDEKTSELKIERHNLQKRMRIDHVERSNAIRDAVVSFAEISAGLYDEPGKFVIDPTENGPKFEFDIPGKKSTGKTKMQIFCFDMMLMKLWANRHHRPDMLVHDSVIFDGVDERQRAKALIIGAKMAEKYNFQYIVTMNSDDMPDMAAFPDFSLENYRVDLEITDTPTGGLFGLRF